MILFIRQFSLFCLLLGGTLYALASQFGAGLIHPLAGYIAGFFALLTFLTYWVTHRLVRISPDNFIAAYFGSMVVRLLLSLTLVLVYLCKHRGQQEVVDTWTFLGVFFILYFIFTGFEIWSVVSNLRPFSKPD